MSNATAMILAAGRGERLRPLTDHTPKPLLEVNSKPMIVWQIEALARAGFSKIVINVSWLYEKLIAALGDGSHYGVEIFWSIEKPKALETAGGIARALPLFANTPIVIASGDLWHNFDYQTLIPRIASVKKTGGAHLVMVDNPPYHLNGDFLLGEGKLFPETQGNAARYQKLTFGNIGIYSPQLFAGLSPNQPAKLAPLFLKWIEQNIVTAEKFEGVWRNIGTVEDLEDVRARL